MAAQTTNGSFPIIFDVEEQNIHEVFDNFDSVIKFLEEEYEFISSIFSNSNSLQGSQLFNSVASISGKDEINSTLRRVHSLKEDPANIADALTVLSRNFIVYRSSEYGEAIQDSLQSSYNVGEHRSFWLLVAAIGSGNSKLRYSDIQGGRTSIGDLILASGAAVELASVRSQPRSRRLEIQKILSSSRKHLKESEGKQREIDRWFEAHRDQLEDATKSMNAKTAALSAAVDASIDKATETMAKAIEGEKSEALQNFSEYRNKTTEDIEKLIFDTKNSLESLESIYSSKLVLSGPSQLWHQVRNRAILSSISSFLLFVLLLSLPLLFAYKNWVEIGNFLNELISHSANGISLTGIVAITIPALGYGWLLRHVSRVFVHNLNLISDAEYREVLATTFLGMAERKSAGITEAERALVLNALFRPAPPNSTDDGPPTGLLDLLGKKPL